MRIVTTVLHVVVLVLMLIGVIFLGSYLAEVLLDAHSSKFFDLKEQLLVASILIALGGLLPIFSKFSMTELVATVVVAQVVVFAIIRSVCGEFDWLVIWWVTRFVTLPFAVSIMLSATIKRIGRRGQPPAVVVNGDGQ